MIVLLKKMNASRMYGDDRLELGRKKRNENAMSRAVAWQRRQKRFLKEFLKIYTIKKENAK